MEIKKVFFPLAGIVFCFLIFMAIYKNKSSGNKLYSTIEAISLMDNIYQDISGFTIQEQERNLIEQAGGNATYGEIKPESLAQILDYFKLSASDVFVDLGSGVGKACVQVALTTPAKAIGIELSTSRHEAAEMIRKELLNRNILTDNKKLQFFKENIAEADLSKATHVFMCSTCFSDDLMKKIADNIALMDRQIYVITLRQLPPSEFATFKEEKVFTLPMTWSANTPVYVYKKELL